jgi:hypothetical protein
MSAAPPAFWPSSFEYAEAIQDPGRFFTEPGLRPARIETDSRGYPVHASGRFAVVFKAAVGQADLAIRCFTERVPAVQERYRQLGAHLTANGQRPPEYFAGFAYQDQGVMVDGTCYPLLQMSWSQGSVLRKWVADNRAHRDRMDALARRWREVMGDLQARGIAHGDLASDNCLVRSQSDFTLIDYDGCYTETLAHRNPGQFGQPDYQHPKRRGYYGPNMDAFPALVIYLSLLAVAADPALWDSFNDEDANLIFTAADYEKPGKTELWHRLKDSSDPDVKTLAGKLERMCDMPVESLRPFSQVVTDGLAWVDDPGLGLAEVNYRPQPEPGRAHPGQPQGGASAAPHVPTVTIPAGPGSPAAPPARRRSWLARGFRRLFGLSG